jgi:ATP-dependent HslUV protease ATP-binding subunit HslU
MSRLLNDLLFDVPDKLPAGTHLVVTPQLVEERLRDMVKNRDLSQYIL